MTPSHYLVIRRGGGWAIRGANRTFGQFSDRVHAIDAVIDFAEKDGKAGRSAKVMLQENGTVCTIWTHGRDPDPTTAGNPANSRAKGHIACHDDHPVSDTATGQSADAAIGRR